MCAAAPPQTSFVLHVDQTSISFPLKPESGKELNEGLQVLLQTFADKQKAERPQRWKSMEFRVKGVLLQLVLAYAARPSSGPTSQMLVSMPERLTEDF